MIKYKYCLSVRPQHLRLSEAALHAEDGSQSVDRQVDPPRQLQLLLQEASHLLGVENVTEHADLRPLPLDVGVARRQL